MEYKGNRETQRLGFMVELKLGFGLYDRIKAIKIGIYGGDRVEILFISILNLGKLFLSCRTNSGKRMVMTWLLMWLNLSVVTLSATF